MSDTNDMRREFEAWCKNQGGISTFRDSTPIANGGTDEYESAFTNHAWWGWQAAKECATAQQDSKDAVRYRLLKSEAYETVVPHGNTLGGFRTAWITKLHPGEDFDAAIDKAVRQGGDT